MIKSYNFLGLLFLCISFQLANAQTVNQFIIQNDKSILEEYVRFLAIPNVSSDSANILKNTAFIQSMMEQRGIRSELLRGTTPNVTPSVYGEIKIPGATKTLGFYAHYDGQPVNPKQWFAGLEPFNPVLITAPLESGGKIIGSYTKGDAVNAEWRISGRGSADDKAGVMAILNAFDALQKTGQKLSANIKFLFEGEEEVSSIHLDEIFKNNKEKLQADCWIIIDGPRHVSGRKTIAFGVRGDVNVGLTIYGPKRPLHSGNYGNWAPNPALAMVQLLASMKDENGKVLVKGFYDDVVPLTASEKKAIADVPNIDEVLRKELGMAEAEGKSTSIQERLMMPTLNINGIQSANVGALAANVIPTKAEATIDLRLVMGNDYKKQVAKVVDHIKSRGYYVLEGIEPTDKERLNYAKIIKIIAHKGYNAQRTPMDLPIAKNIAAAVQSTTKEPMVLLPTVGGSLPLFLFEEILGTKVITIPIVNYDNNQHAENENVKIKFLWEGIETIAAVMAMK